MYLLQLSPGCGVFYIFICSLSPLCQLQNIAITMDILENLNFIGEGAFGKVWKCRHKNSQHLVAIKEFRGGNLEKTISQELVPIRYGSLAPCDV